MHTRLLAAALVGGLLTLGVREVHARRPPLGTPTETIPVSYQIVRSVSPECRAVSRVEGSVSIVRPPRGADFDLTYRPTLTVRSRVACTDGTVRRFAPRTIHNREFSSEQLAQAISIEGGFVSEVPGAHVCIVTPIAHVDARDITFRGMTASCRPTARGGGPTVSDPSWCVGVDARRDPGCAQFRATNR